MIMGIERTPFRRSNLDPDPQDIFSVKLNPQERISLNEDKLLIQQTKDSTAIKILARVGSFVLHDPPTRFLIRTIFINQKKNKRIGIPITDLGDLPDLQDPAQR
jgi:hypothetical protein